MPRLKDDIPRDFQDPTGLPQTAGQARAWQEANRTWWESHPMRYDWTEEIDGEEFSPAFYADIDRRFFASAAEFMSWDKIPFDGLIDFDGLKDRDVLEIGVGNGSHARLLAQHARSFTGIDLTDYAVKSTARRMELEGLAARILRMDAESMQFADASFDFIWTWGVIHHSADTARVLREMHRVLRPGGQATVMVYHRNWYNYTVLGSAFLLGNLLRGQPAGALSLHRTVQQRTDGALARFYTLAEWRALVAPLFEVRSIQVFGNKAAFVPLPAGRLKKAVIALIPNRAGRFLSTRCRLGDLLVSTLRKK